jgi:hypothetical protein
VSRHRAQGREQDRRRGRSRVRGARRAGLVVASVMGLAGVFGAGQSMLSTEPAPATAADEPPASVAASAAWAGSPDQHWARVLGRLDDRRALAFSRADPGLLDKVYLTGSGLRDRDARTIDAYARRGLRIEGLHMTIRALRVEVRTASTAVLSVVDRISRAARAVNSAGRSRALPRDRATAHRVTLRRVPAGWRVAAISDRSPRVSPSTPH